MVLGGGGGDFLTKVGTDVRQVQNLGRAKFPKNLMPGQKVPKNLMSGQKVPKNLMLGQKVPKNLMTGQVFENVRVPKFEILSKIVKHLMLGLKLTPEIPDAHAHTSVPTLIMESPPPPPQVISIPTQ